MLLLTACGAPAEADDTAGKGTQRTAKVNGKTLTYQAWKKAGLPASGSYYLTKDVQLDAFGVGLEDVGDGACVYVCDGGVITIYGSGTLTTNGTECTQTSHAWSGEWIQNP